MPTATVTVRELKNQDTGIDISIPTYKEVPGLLGSVYEYQVVVVSRLAFFKSPKHKESDVVQYMVLKKFAEFEDLHSKLNTQYSATVLPPLPKKVLIVNDSTAKQRRGGLENFIKFLSRTPKLCTSPLLLEFLGVSAVKAGKFRKMELREGHEDEEEEKEKSEGKKEDAESTDDPDSKGGLFDEEEQEGETDLFMEEETDRGDIDIPMEDETDHGDINISSKIKTTETKLFEDPDLGGGIREGEGDDFLFAPDTVPAESQQSSHKPDLFDEEDNSELFEIDDDLDKFLSLDLKSDASKNPDSSDNAIIDKPDDEPSISKSSVETQERSIDKPQIPARPKPAPRSKPTIAKKLSVEGTTEEVTKETKFDKPPKPAPRQKPQVGKKPVIAQKPALPNKPGKKVEAKVEKGDKSSDLKGDLTQDDILQYIQDNDNADDVDLFS